MNKLKTCLGVNQGGRGYRLNCVCVWCVCVVCVCGVCVCVCV